VVDELDGTPTGTGAYLATVRLNYPYLILIYVLKVNMSHNGISKIYIKCCKFHKRDMNFDKCHWLDYVTHFKTDNPQIEVAMVNGGLE
jgi:hypothetical protein